MFQVGQLVWTGGGRLPDYSRGYAVVVGSGVFGHYGWSYQIRYLVDDSSVSLVPGWALMG